MMLVFIGLKGFQNIFSYILDYNNNILFNMYFVRMKTYFYYKKTLLLFKCVCFIFIITFYLYIFYHFYVVFDFILFNIFNYLDEIRC